MKTSEQIKNFADFLRETEKRYRYHLERIAECERRTMDYLHYIELTDESSKCRSRATTRERQNRRERKISKDYVTEVENVIGLLKYNPDLLKNLEAVLGETRKVEKYHMNRTYVKRGHYDE